MTGIKLIATALVATAGAAQPPPQEDPAAAQPEWFEHRASRAWLEEYDPTLLTRRLLTQAEYEELHDGDANIIWLSNLRWAFPIGKSVAFGLQLETPLRWTDVAGEHSSGLGDIELRAGLVFREAGNFRWALGLNSKFPTATSSSLGDGVVALRPQTGFRWEATGSLELGVNVEYSFTPGDEAGHRVSALEFKFPLVAKLAENLSGLISYNPRWNYANDSSRHRLELSLSRAFGSENKYAIATGAEIPLAAENLNWKAILGLTRYFR